MQNGTGEESGYKLVWQDLFDNRKLDDKIWNIEINGDGGGNNELQYYHSDNVTVANDDDGNGCLIITAEKNNFRGKEFKSGRINSLGNMEF